LAIGVSSPYVVHLRHIHLANHKDCSFAAKSKLCVFNELRGVCWVVLLSSSTRKLQSSR